jgi:hypothetical protein
MEDSSLRLIYDCRLSKIGSSAHRFIDPSEGHGVGFNGPMAKTVVSDWWRVASKEQSGELNHESQIANWRWKVANHKSKIGNRKSKMIRGFDGPIITACHDVSETKGVSSLE